MPNSESSLNSVYPCLPLFSLCNMKRKHTLHGLVNVTFYLTHLRLVDSSTINVWTGLFPIAGCLFCFFYYNCFIVVNANSVGPDQRPHNAASDLVLHCLFTLWGVSRLKWIKTTHLP